MSVDLKNRPVAVWRPRDSARTQPDRPSVIRHNDVDPPVVVRGEEAPPAAGNPALSGGHGLQAGREISNGVDDLDRDSEILAASACLDIEYSFTCLRFSDRARFYPAGDRRPGRKDHPAAPYMLPGADHSWRGRILQKIGDYLHRNGN